MAQIRPFPGILYRVPESELGRVLAPPYDVIPAAYQDELYARDPRNVVRVILNRTPGDAGYAEAGETYARWLAEGVLAADPEPALYVLAQRFTAEGRTYTRHGVLARFRAEPPGSGVIRPHEHTRAAAKEDRWRVLNATRANFSPIFLMVPDADEAFTRLVVGAQQGAPLQYTDDGGVEHGVTRVTHRASLAAFEQLLGARPAYIADGHHRHATALRYADAHGPEGAWTLGYFTPMGAPGLVVLPYHRILAGGPSLDQAEAALRPHFSVTRLDGVPAAAEAAQRSQAGYAFALCEPGGAALLAEAPAEARSRFPAGTPACLAALDTYFLHQTVLEPLLRVPSEAVSYVHSLAEAQESVEKGRCRLAVVMRATPVSQIVDVADARESMPAKSTFFHPKLPSGLVIHPLLA